MLYVRPVHDLDEFAGLPGDPPDYADTIAALWEGGESQPGWCFLGYEDDDPIARIGFRLERLPTEFCRDLAPAELHIFGLSLPWQRDPVRVGAELLKASLSSIATEAPDELHWRVNAEIHSHHTIRNAVAHSAGLTLLQEKLGYWWEDDGSPQSPLRLEYRPIDEVGETRYALLMGECQVGTLDRNDRHYFAGCGAEGWGRTMLGYLEPDDREMWLAAYSGPEPVGYVTVVTVDDWGSTIGHVGVLPKHRGNGYIDDLLAAATAVVRRRGITTMLSDVDVENAPMRAAFRKAGHRESARPWHVWQWRGSIRTLIADD